MRHLLTVCCFFLVVTSLCRALPAEGTPSLFSRTYGSPADPAIVLLHGGPGYNAVGFELAVAQPLADAGLYVVVYDQRGCGRSKEYAPNDDYSFAAQCADLDTVMARHGVKSATLIGHSWGGTLATRYAQAHPEKVEQLIMVASPVSYQMTFRHILQRCDSLFTAKHDTTGLMSVARVRKLDTASLFYATGCFQLAMQNGFYTVTPATPSAYDFYRRVTPLPDAKYLREMLPAPTMGAYKAEKYTTLNMFKDWKDLSAKTRIFFIVGEEDRLFDQAQLDMVAGAIKGINIAMIPQASHNVFIDQTSEFTRAVIRMMAP